VIGLHDKSGRRLGALLGALAVYVQLAVASWGLAALTASIASADALGAHALCLAAAQEDSGALPAPVPSTPRHNHAALCCPWHTAPAAVPPAAAAVPLPYVYAETAAAPVSLPPFVARLHGNSANARAPPILS
jgi:hypothetical protein